MTTILPPYEYAARKRTIAQFFARNKTALIAVLEEAHTAGVLAVPDGITIEDIVGASIGALALVAEATDEAAAQLDDDDAARPVDEDER